jgi:hypothetical protein
MTDSKPGMSEPFSTIAFELADEEAALGLGKQISERTGRTVTVRDADGNILGTFQAAPKN